MIITIIKCVNSLLTGQSAHDLIGLRDDMSILIGCGTVRSLFAGQSSRYVRKITLTVGGWNGFFTFLGSALLIAEFSSRDASSAAVTPS